MEHGDIAIIAFVLVVAAAAVLIWLAMRRRQTGLLRERFGEEYDRTLREEGRRSAAEAALRARERRVQSLNIRALTAEERGAFADEWREVRGVFVDSPPEAVLHADRLTAKMMVARGFPMGDFERRYEDLSVDHPEVARHYRAGHDLADRHARGAATTEDLRQAMKHYEALFDALLKDRGSPSPPTIDTQMGA